MNWFDAHLDLAYLAETGRDMHVGIDECRGRHQPAAVTLPSLAAGGVTHCLATIFTEAIPDPTAPDAEVGAWTYPIDDALAAWKAGQRQLKLYQAWRDAGMVELMNGATGDPKGTRVETDDYSSEPRASARAAAEDSDNPPLTLGILMECADPIERPEQLGEWADAGVVAIGLTWMHRGRYAGGNGVKPGDPADGLTGSGHDLLAEMHRLGVVCDLSHLSQRSTDEVLEAFGGRIIASHSNARALHEGAGWKMTQRHLTDDTIAAIAQRGGIIGVNLFSPFLRRGLKPNQRATIDDVCAHIDHICTAVGGTGNIGLGSDMDGGFAADCLPEHIDTPADLVRIAEALHARGWGDHEINGFAMGNWARFWNLVPKQP